MKKEADCRTGRAARREAVRAGGIGVSQMPVRYKDFEKHVDRTDIYNSNGKPEWNPIYPWYVYESQKSSYSCEGCKSLWKSIGDAEERPVTYERGCFSGLVQHPADECHDYPHWEVGHLKLVMMNGAYKIKLNRHGTPKIVSGKVVKTHLPDKKSEDKK